MSDERQDDERRDHDELDDLEPLDEIEPLEEPESMDELEPLPEDAERAGSGEEPAGEEPAPGTPPAASTAPEPEPPERVLPEPRSPEPQSPAPKPEPPPPAPRAEQPAPPAPKPEAPAPPPPKAEEPPVPGPEEARSPEPEREPVPPAPPASGAGSAPEEPAASQPQEPENPADQPTSFAPPPDAPPPGREPARPTKKPGEKRELEQAPLHLRKAALIVGAGALLPFFTALDADEGIAWGPLYGAKLVALLAGYLFHQGYMATHGGQAVGFVASMAKAHKLVPGLVAGLVAVASMILAWGCPHVGYSLGEVLTLLLASATYSHIWGYEHGGKFNPLYPLMFLGPLIAGLLNTIGAAAAFGVENHAGIPILGLLGSLTVFAGGALAVYTMYEAMKQAKAEGDRKREEMRQYRKQQREEQRARRQQQG